jgi:hypothetical protein
MTFLCMGLAMGSGIPVWLIALAMLCDTILLATAMFTGIIPHHQ